MKAKTLILAVLAIVIVLGLGFAIIYRYKAELYAEANKLALVPEPQRFTELYFVNPGTLPDQIPANKQINFAFTIHNLEGATTTYPYTVSFTSNTGQTEVIDLNSVTLAQQEYKTITESYKLNKTDSYGQVTITLNNLSQQIDFLLESPIQIQFPGATNLNFVNASSLPAFIPQSEKISFSFSIQNQEGLTEKYPYTVVFYRNDGKNFTLDQNTVTIANGQTQVIPESHQFKQSGQQGEVIVDLTQLNQQIDFLLSTSTPQ